MPYQKIIKHAFHSVPFYEAIKNNLDGNNSRNIFHNLPIVNRRDIVGNEESFISSNFNTKELNLHYTSGSTGIPLKCYKSNTDVIRMGKALWQRRNWFGDIKPTHKYVTFFIRRYDNDKKPTHKKIIVKKNNLSLSLIDINDDILRSYYDALLNFEPRWIFAPPSIMYYLSRYIDKSSKKKRIPNLALIELTGEYCTQNQKEYIQEVFNCQVTNMYGTKETWGIAYQCPLGHMHLMEDNVHMEIDKDNEIIITGLNGYAMPIIKYLVGDSGRWTDNECMYSGKTVEIISSRSGNYFSYKGNLISNAIFFLAVTDLHREFPRTIEQFQVERVNESLFNFHYIPGNNFKESNLRKYSKIIEQKVKDIKIEFIKTDFISFGSNAKISNFVEKIL